MDFTPLINGRSYGWADITANILGVAVAGITSISYKDDQQIDNIYGAGKKPVSRGYGRETYEASITMLSEEVENLVAAAPNGRIQDIPEFPIIVAYMPETGNVVMHVLQYCRFKNNGRDTKEGDTSIEVTLDLAVGNIKWK